MNHRIGGRKLQRTTDHREAMLKNMVTSLISNDQIITTDAKAKELRKLADKMIGLGKKGDLASVREAARVVKTKEAIGKLFKELGPRFKERNGGYTTLIKYKSRKGDGAPMTIIKWTEDKKASGGDKE
jgi:large subunit ribosomal protein L17